MFSHLGIVGLFIVFILPIICYVLLRWRHAKKSQSRFLMRIIGKLKKYSLNIILFYFFAISSFTAILSPVAVERVKSVGWSLQAALDSLNDSGVILLPLLPAVVVISFVMDYVIKQIGQYKFRLGGFTDPVTGDDNISLRQSTFFKIINTPVPDPSAKKLGRSSHLVFVRTSLSTVTFLQI